MSVTGVLMSVNLCKLRFNLNQSVKNLGHWSASPKVILAARSTLRNLEDIKTVLAGLSTSGEEIVKEIKEHIRPFEFGMGLSSLPDEMLSKIFEHALEGQRSGRASSKGAWSLVCRQFRRVVLSTPRLWSRIRSSDRVPYVRTCLKRSKSVGLSIYLYLINDHGQPEDMKRDSLFLAAVVPHSAR